MIFSFGKKKKKNSNTIQDVFFLIGIIVLSSVLIIGLFPGRMDAGLVDENFFITAMMTIPIIAGIYLIVISFRRSINISSSDLPESIKKKITLSFVFIAVLSSMPIVIISSTYFNKSLSKMFSGRTMRALDESVELTHSIYLGIEKEVRSELKTIRFTLDSYLSGTSRNEIDRFISVNKGTTLKIIFFKETANGPEISENGMPGVLPDNSKLYKFYRYIDYSGIRTDRIEIDGNEILSGILKYKDLVIVVYLPVSEKFKATEELFIRAREDYRIIESQKEYFETGTGSFLMFISIVIIGIAYLISLYISGNITRPVLELSGAAKKIAMGDYKLSISKRSDDEIGTLVDTFNFMASQLEENQKSMFQKQKLEAWNEMARKLVHEIKNPLTPIRLSAERMRKLVMEMNPRRDDAVVSGTETIISEVNSLMKLVGEFNNFARLPEKKAESSSLNAIVEDSIRLFSSYENVNFNFIRGDGMYDIMLDRSLVRQALNNIIGNSIQAFDGNGNIKIITGYDESGLYQTLRIIDNGPGISREDIEKIFEPGFTLKKGGTGLGLAIVEKIVFEHAGKIYCRSDKGEGAEFVLMFPVIDTGVI